MLTLPILTVEDQVEIIAPASRCTEANLIALQDILSTWQVKWIVNDHLFGPDLLCAHSDQHRFESLKNALLNPKNKAVICARGGYGSMRLIPELAKITPSPTCKLFVGMSDITALNIFLQQQWQWPVIHGALAPDKYSPESTAALKSLLWGAENRISFQGEAYNLAAQQDVTLESTVIGGNLSLLQTSIGTLWQVNGQKKILFIEEVSERGYRIDRMLEHMRQAGIFDHVAAIVFGDFIGGEEPNGSSLVNSVLLRFAESCQFPVIKVHGIGHGYHNHPLPMGTKAQLSLGHHIELACFSRD